LIINFLSVSLQQTNKIRCKDNNIIVVIKEKQHENCRIVENLTIRLFLVVKNEL